MKRDGPRSIPSRPHPGPFYRSIGGDIPHTKPRFTPLGSVLTRTSRHRRRSAVVVRGAGIAWFALPTRRKTPGHQ